MVSEREIAAMRRALHIAATAGVPRGPNPRVGAVLLDADGDVVAEGYHRGIGTPHAEVDALSRAGTRACGATMVVTLEPCDHVGRTGPCTAALLAAGVGRVVYAQADGNPVARGGTATLRAGGVDVEGCILSAAARALNPAWTTATERGRPHVTWKFAATLDGRSAAADGTSRWVTSLAAREDVHRLRAEHDTVLVGSGTVLADDPHLTVRGRAGPLSPDLQPLRAVMGCRDLPAEARVRDTAAETVHLRTRDPQQALCRLHAAGRQLVLLEGGPTLAGAFLRAGYIDEVVTYLAPALLGDGVPALASAGIASIDDAVRLDLHEVATLGPDIRITARITELEA